MSKSQTAIVAEAASLDPLWQTVRDEVSAIAAREPILASFLHASVLNHKTMEHALAFILAGKLECAVLPAMLVRELIQEACEADRRIVDSIRTIPLRIFDGYEKRLHRCPRIAQVECDLWLFLGLFRFFGLNRLRTGRAVRGSFRSRAVRGPSLATYNGREQDHQNDQAPFVDRRNGCRRAKAIDITV